MAAWTAAATAAASKDSGVVVVAATDETEAVVVVVLTDCESVGGTDAEAESLRMSGVVTVCSISGAPRRRYIGCFSEPARMR